MEKGDIMKSIKKYILIITMALLTITLSACSKVTPEQALNKVAEANKNIKTVQQSSQDNSRKYFISMYIISNIGFVIC